MINQGTPKKFISICNIRKRIGKKPCSRVPRNSAMTISQTTGNKSGVIVKFITIWITENIMSLARFKRGDRVDIGITEDSTTWRLRVVGPDELGYKITAPATNQKRGRLRFTWSPEMPVFGNDESILRARAFINAEEIIISPTEITFTVSEIDVESRKESSQNLNLFFSEGI